MSDEPLVLTVEEAAQVLRIGRSAAYEAVKRGELPAVRLGRSLRVPRHALEQLLNLNGLGPADEGPTTNGAGGKAGARKGPHDQERNEQHRGPSRR